MPTVVEQLREEVFAYVVIVRDPDQAATLQATYPDGLSGYSPIAGSTALGIAIPAGGASLDAIDYVILQASVLPTPLVLTTDLVASPDITPSWATGGDVRVDVASGGVQYEETLGLYTYRTTIHWAWVGYVLAGGGGDAAAPPTVADRRWIMGFELPPGGEGISPVDTSALQHAISRDASRSVEGYGLAIREARNAHVIRRINEYGTTPSEHSWERLYIRLRALPNVDECFWSMTGSADTDFGGLRLGLTTTGTLTILNQSLFGGFTTLATGPTLDLDRWYRLDILVSYAIAPSTAGIWELWVNGVQEGSGTVAYNNGPFGGLGRPQTHLASKIGEIFNLANTLALDIDDWSNREDGGANNWATLKLTVDWLNGSTIKRLHARAFAASHGVWTGDWRTTLENPVAGSIGRLTSATGGARLAITTDTLEHAALGLVNLGASAYLASLYGHRGSGGSGTLGTPSDLQAITQSTSDEFQSILFGSLGAPTDVSALEIAHERGSAGGTASIGLLGGVVEYLGIFGEEDVLPTDPTEYTFPLVLRHNAPYPGFQQIGRLTTPLTTVSIAGGTYVGNGTGQDIVFTITDPPHWIWIRPLSAPAGGVRWMAAATAAEAGVNQTLLADGVVEALNGDDGQGFRVSGDASQVNAAGVTYQFIAFCDPGLRYCCGGAMRHTNVLTEATDDLDVDDFTGLAVFLADLRLAASTGGLWYKGSGHATTEANLLDTAGSFATVVALGYGALTTYQQVFDATGNRSLGYLAFRVVDGSAAPAVVVQILSYTGNGAGQRTITLTPTSGRWPMFALVVPHSGSVGVCRDPSHSGTTSAVVTDLTDTSTGIVGGGIDQITVHSNFNTLGVVYEVFVIPGCEGNTGWDNGQCVVAPPYPSPGPWPPSPSPPPPGPTPPTPPPTPPTPPPLPGACQVGILGGGA